MKVSYAVYNPLWEHTEEKTHPHWAKNGEREDLEWLQGDSDFGKIDLEDQERLWSWWREKTTCS